MHPFAKEEQSDGQRRHGIHPPEGVLVIGRRCMRKKERAAESEDEAELDAAQRAGCVGEEHAGVEDDGRLDLGDPEHEHEAKARKGDDQARPAGVFETAASTLRMSKLQPRGP